ncbi:MULTISPECIES: hypothetical protein [unclassified Corallococcus]|uniref:hypothetical protein n=1 Tax=unclassified Corallococcus TaxID=2685029 RepID=UPI001A8C5747|nr:MULTISPECIES: hypothetical protein [unclassified Corallococcus]MBN9685860.1 hypothetical protein [Corallococcus sp. NCSPR001]WAS82700.1 hypothetical protein O0N60_25635 [Corallococcus sp. NCRR]
MSTAIAASLLYVVAATPPEAFVQPVCKYEPGTVYKLKSVHGPSASKPAHKTVPIANGYHLNVSVNGGLPYTVLVDTGSNLLVLPYDKVGGLPADPKALPSSSLVVSGLVPYGYGSSGFSYRGYLVDVPVTVNPVPANAALPNAPTAAKVTVYAVTETCGKESHCEPVTKNSTLGMMGVGFQPTPAQLVRKDGTLASHTNVFAELPNLPAVGYIFGPEGITVGLNETETRGITWARLDTNGKASGCLTITPSNGGPGKPLCGTMLLDTGVGELFAWVGAQTQCPAQAATAQVDGGAVKAGFGGVPFPDGTTIQITSPSASPSMSYSFTVGKAEPGTPKPALCIASPEPHSNIGRMPLQRFRYVRNESCKAFGFLKP